MSRRTMAVLLGCWAVAIAAGMSVMSRHVAIAGTDVRELIRWPTGSELGRTSGRSTLLCFVHPRCPCTRATMRELERVVSRAPTATVTVVFRVDPGGDLTSTSTWAMAARIPGARRVRDPGGREAARFGATTSGLVMLFDARGVLRFRGGVTSARGHEGGSEGASALEAALHGHHGGQQWARVFGCGLVER